MAEFGTLASLGAGSNNVLSFDKIDGLKEIEKKAMVAPAENKLDMLKKKEKALSEFITIGATVKSDVLDLADGTLFAKVSSSVSGDSVSVKADDGVKPQTFKIDVEQLAQNDVYQSEGFSSQDYIINSSADSVTLKIGIGGNLTSFTLSSNATLNDLKDAINDADADVTASIIDTGLDENPYKLILKAKNTGEDNVIEFDYSAIENLNLNATNYASASYSSDSDLVNDSGSDQTFKITVNGTDYTMNVLNGTTVNDFIDALNNGELKDSDGNSLKINATYNNDTNAINFNIQAIGNITIDDTNLTTNFNDNTDFSNNNRLQVAQDAKFKYNGVDIQRATNKVEDLIKGVNVELKKTGESTVSITSNIDDMIKSIKQFVADYNSMISNLQNLIAYNKDEGTVGLFQGDSNFTMLSSKFSDDIFNPFLNTTEIKTDLNGREYKVNTIFTATNVGFEQNRSGMISFKEEEFKKAYEKKPELVKELFGKIFTNLKNDFEMKITGDKSNLNLLDKEIKDEEDDYEDRIKTMNDFLDTKYEIMAKRYAAYDNIIGQFDAQTQALQMAISAAIAAKS